MAFIMSECGHFFVPQGMILILAFFARSSGDPSAESPKHMLGRRKQFSVKWGVGQ